MNGQNTSKVAVDPAIATKIPTVVIAAPPPQGNEEVNQPRSSLPALFMKQVVHFFMDFLETIVVALSIFVVVYLFFMQPHEIKGSSMEPNFHNGEYILTDKISYRFRTPSRGDVIILKAPKNPEVDYIKRVIGLPGERIKVERGQVFINETKVDERYVSDATPLFPGSFLQDGVEITVPEDEYFVMGDNRPHSSDSREFGPIGRNLIIGKAFFRYWPLTEIGVVPKINYQNLSFVDKSSEERQK